MSTPIRTTVPLQTLTAQGAATVVTPGKRIVQMGRFEDLIFVSNADDNSPTVVLVHLSESILRNLTRTRDFQTKVLNRAMKPRFVMSRNTLSKVATSNSAGILGTPRSNRCRASEWTRESLVAAWFYCRGALCPVT